MLSSFILNSGRRLRLYRSLKNNLWNPYFCREHSSRCADLHRADHFSVASIGALKEITIVDNTSDCAHVLKHLIGLGPEQPVAWSVQSSKGTMPKGSNDEPFFTMSGYAGQDIDFGSGPHLFIRGQDGNQRDRVWDLLKAYFSDDACPKIWLDYASAQSTLSHSGIELQGFNGDLLNMAKLTDKDIDFGHLESYANAFMKSTEVTECVAVLENYYMGFDLREPRPWENSQKLSIHHVDTNWIAQACAYASLTYHLFEKLRSELQRLVIEGKNSTYDFQSSIHNLAMVYMTFFVPLVREIYQMQASGVAVDSTKLTVEKLQREEQIRVLESKFIRWASEFSPEAKFMDLSSRSQLQQLLFAPCKNVHVKSRSLPHERIFKRRETGNGTEAEQLVASDDEAPLSSFRIRGKGAKAKIHTATGWPSTATEALRKAAGYPRADSPTFGQKDESFCYAVDSLLSARQLRRRGVGTSQKAEFVFGEDNRVHVPFSVNKKTGHLQGHVGDSAEHHHINVLKSALCAAPGNTLVIGRYKHLGLSLLSQLSGCDKLRLRLASQADSHELVAYQLFDNVREAVDVGKCRFGSYNNLRTFGLCESTPSRNAQVGYYDQADIDCSQSIDPVAVLFSDWYRKGKLVDFAVVNGGSRSWLAEQLIETPEEAGALLAKWYYAHPAVLKWREECIDIAESQGYIETMMGRRKKTENLTHENVIIRKQAEASALQYTISGSAGEAVMGAIIKLGRNEMLQALGWRVVFVDEGMVILEGPEYSTEEATPIVRDTMRSPMDFELDLYLDVDLLSGRSLVAMGLDGTNGTLNTIHNR